MTQAILHPDGTLLFAGRRLRAAIGRAGIRGDKQEGDGATPAGDLTLRRVLYRADRIRPPVCSVPLEPIAPNDGWCDDLRHPDYNRMVTLPHPGRAEELWRQDALYDIVGVLGWNDDPVERGRGSAIFLHVSRPDYAPTEGCVALPVDTLRQLLAEGLSLVTALTAA
jgi:L,D-peptidoglycan transpeptidase YkuD (ErfK/YbiS/YcfS/YnhG family)